MRDWLKELREKAQLSQTQLAAVIGITQQQYSFIENGKRGVRVTTAKKIAAALGFDWQKFYEDTAEE